MTEQKTPAKARLTLWQRAARAYLEAQGFRAQPGLFRTVADALADHFAASPEPFRLPLALGLFDQAEALAAFQANAGPLGFADARRLVESLQADFPQATPEHVRVTLNLLETGGWVNAAFGCIDPASGEAVACSDAEIASLLERLSVPDQQAAACERLARIAVEWRAVAPLENVD